MARPRILVVDDDPAQRELLSTFLGGKGYEVSTASSGEEAMGLLGCSSLGDGPESGEAPEPGEEPEEGAPPRPPRLAILDVRLPGASGLETFRRIREQAPGLPVVFVTAYADLRDAVSAMKEGAVDYLEKPIDLEELAAVVADALGEIADEHPEAPLPPLPEGLVAASPALHRIIEEAGLVAPTDATVLITGESGAGKEIVADLIHAWSPRAAEPFLKVNCAAIPETLLESELFGHERGAFTGAESRRIGHFEAAGRGSLLLDEIGEMPVGLQVKLLRVLEGSSFSRLGGDEVLRAGCRVMASTNRDLAAAVEDGRFRQDLFYRINVFQIHVPPLRERREDILPLARNFLRLFAGERARLAPATIRCLEGHHWKGNVRELRNCIERAAILCRGELVLPEHLPAYVREGGTPGPEAPEPGTLTVAEAERRAIRQALHAAGGNRTRAAQLLGISRRTLLYRLKEYGQNP